MRCKQKSAVSEDVSRKCATVDHLALNETCFDAEPRKSRSFHALLGADKDVVKGVFGAEVAWWR